MCFAESCSSLIAHHLHSHIDAWIIKPVSSETHVVLQIGCFPICLIFAKLRPLCHGSWGWDQVLGRPDLYGLCTSALSQGGFLL